MKNILLTISLIMFVGFNLLSQTNLTKESLTRNWMVWSVKLPQQAQKTRAELNQEPKADFVINQDGSYHIKFEHIGKGTWRLEDDFIMFWSEKTESKKTTLELLVKVKKGKDEELILKLFSPTKHYDWEITLVPFN